MAALLCRPGQTVAVLSAMKMETEVKAAAHSHVHLYVVKSVAAEIGSLVHAGMRAVNGFLLTWFCCAMLQARHW